MSCNYAEGLSPYHDKGQLGLEEKFDSKSVVSAKVSLLTKWINEAKHVVIHTGAGISTSAGIPDFRGPKGVWTLEAKGEKPDLSKDFNEAIPTITHMAIVRLVEKRKVKHVVSQNIDGLHLRSNLQRKFLSELHGNMFTEQCNFCHRQFVRSVPVPTIGQKTLNKPCPALKANGRPCRGRLHDTILDWEHNLPENDLGMADYHSCLADLSICLGTTMQIVPSGNLPLYTKKHGGKLVIVNLQPTKHDRKADLLIHAYVDEVMTMLMKNLYLKIPKYSPKNDPTRTLALSSEKFFEWTISDYALKKMKKIYEEKCGTKEAKKRLEMIDDDIPLSIAKTFKRKVKDEEDSDLEVLDVIVRPKRGRESSKRGPKKSSTPVYNTTITIKKVTPSAKKAKFETPEKITIKKNVTPTKTKYEIVTKPKKGPKCEIVYNTENELCDDLDMVCESDDDDMTNNFTYNFKRYLYDDVKREDTKETPMLIEPDKGEEMKPKVKSEIKTEEEAKPKADSCENKVEEKKVEIIEEDRKNSSEEKEKIKEIVMIQESSKKISKAEVSEQSKEVIEKPPENISCKPNSASDSSNNENCLQQKLESLRDISQSEKDVTNTSGKNSEEGENEEHQKNKEKENFEKESKDETELRSGQTSVKQINSDSNLQEENSKKKFSAKENESSITELDKEKLESTEVETQIKENENTKTFFSKIEEIENNTCNKECQNVESSNLSNSNSNVESEIRKTVTDSEPCQFNNSFGISNCSINPTVNENFEFYSSEFNSSNNSTDLDYADNNYYNSF